MEKIETIKKINIPNSKRRGPNNKGRLLDKMNIAQMKDASSRYKVVCSRKIGVF